MNISAKKTDKEKKFIKKAPCNICIKEGLHCCNTFPLFKNEELAELIDSGYLDKINKPVRVIRYKNEIFTCVNLNEDINKQINELKTGERNCMFFDEEKGCLLGEKYMPLFCKEKRRCDSIIACSFCGYDEEGFKKLSKEEKIGLKLLNSAMNQRYEIAMKKIFNTDTKEGFTLFSNTIKKKNKKNKKKAFNYTKDEIIFLVAFHCITENKEFLEEKGILKIEEKKRLFIDTDGKIIITKNLNFTPLTDEPLLKEFLLKFTNLTRLTISSYLPEKQTVLEAKTNSILKGMHNYGIISDEKLKKYGFLATIVLMYYYKDKFKMKNNQFKGIFKFKEFETLGNLMLDLLVEEGIDEVEVMNEVVDFADTFIKRVIKEKK